MACHSTREAFCNEVSGGVAKCAWARLIEQVCEVDPLVCPRCVGAMRIIAVIEQPAVIEKMLAHLGLWPVAAHSPPAGVPGAGFSATRRAAA